MSVKSFFHFKKLRQFVSCLLVPVLLPIQVVRGQSSSTIVLSAAATPGVAEPAVTAVTITGSGFPVGTIAPSSVTVKLTPVVPAVGPAMVAVVSGVITIAGSSRRIVFQVAPANPVNNVQTPTAYQVSVSGISAAGVSFSSSNMAALTMDPPASIQSVSPASGMPGQQLSVAITGHFSNFFQGSTVASFGPDISVGGAASGTFGPVTVTSATSATAEITLTSTAAPGGREVDIRTGSELAVLPNGFDVAAAPLLTQVNPNIGQQGQQDLSVTLTGQFTHFAQGSTTASFGPGTTLISLSVSSEVAATAVLNIATTATAGARDVTVTTGTETVTLTGGFTVTNGTPALTQVSPNTGQQGTLVTPRTGIITFDNPPPGLTPNFFIQGTLVAASSQLTSQFENLGVIFSTFGGAPYAALIDLTGQAPSGTNGVGAVNSSGNVDYTQDLDIFLVVPGTSSAAVTDFISIQGDEDPLPGNVVFSAYDMNGNLLASGAQPDTAGGVYSLSAPGIHEFRLHSTSGTVAYDNLSFNVPATLLSIALTGQFTHFAQATTTVSFGQGITVASLIVNSPTSATAMANINSAASVGVRDVTVTTGAEIVTLANGFTVTNGTPLLSQVNPISAPQGQQNLSVAVTGQFTHFAQGSSAVSFGPDVTVSSLTVNSATSASAFVNIAATATVGSRDVTVTTGGEVATLVDGFNVANAPVLTQLIPNNGSPGQQNVSVTMLGRFTHFAQGTSTASFGAGITVVSLTVNSETFATTVLNISAAAAPGIRDVSLTTGGEIVTLVSGFTVTPPVPLLTQATPDTGQQGQQDLTVVLTGQSTHFVQGMTAVSFGVGISVVSLTVTSATSATAVLNISATAAPGARDIAVVTGTETAILAGGFLVTPGSPVLTSVSPNSGQQGQNNVAVTINGQFTHFSAASVVSFTGGAMSAGMPIPVSSTSLTVPVTIGLGATPGMRGVQIMSGTETVSLANAFTVAVAGPSITSVTPGSSLPGQSVQVTITAQNTHFVQGATAANFGPGVMVGSGMAGSPGSVVVTSPTTATAQLSIPANAEPGSRTVYVSTGTEQAFLINGFAINGTPALSSVAPSSGQLGQTLTVTIGGRFTNFQQGLTVASFGAGISVGGASPGTAGPVTVASPTSATAQLTIASNAVVGLRTLSVTTGTQQESLSNIFVVLGPVTGAPPAVSITSPTEASTVTTLTTVTGTVTSPNLANWILEYSSSGGTGFVRFAEGTGPAVSGTFDPSLLLNGMAAIRLTATDQSGQTTSTSVNVVLTRNAKIGNFTLTFTDVSIPVAGLPIQVNRTYDSRNKASGDFGFGWSLSYNTVNVQVNGIMGNNWSGTSTGGFFPTYCVQPPPNFVVSVRLQNGTVYQFAPVAGTQCESLTPPESVDIAFVPIGQTPSTATLSAPGGTGLLISGSFPGSLQLLDFDTALAFDPDQFILTMPNGETLQLSRTFGLQTLIDTKGNSLTFGANGITSSTGKVVSFKRDASGRINTITDPNQNVLAYAYSTSGDLATSANASNNTSAYSYDAVHDLLSYTTPLGVQGVRNTYDDAGRLIQVTDALGHVTNFGNDPVSRIESITDALGNPTTYAYDASGDLLSATDPLGQAFTSTFDANGNELTSSSPLGLIAASTYDSANNLLSETDALGNTFQYTYNGFGQVLTTTDPRGHITTNTYDDAGDLISTRKANGDVVSKTYNLQGQPLTSVDALGQVTSYMYDGDGFLTQQTDPAGVVTTYTSDANGNRLTSSVQRTRSDGSKETLLTQFQYDARNNLLVTINPDGFSVENTYDALNRKIAVKDARGLLTQYSYDDNGRQTQIRYPDGSTTSTAYDANGNRLATTDQRGFTTSYQYDADNRLTATVSPDGTKVTMTYDAMGRVVRSVDQLLNPTTFIFDAAGRQTSVTNSMGQTTSMAYDAYGNQISQTDANKNVTRYVYDLINRRTGITYPDSTSETIQYDANGNLTAVTDQAGKTTLRSYDKLGRVLSTTDAAGQVTSYSYDEVGNRLSQTDGSGRQTLYSYDEMGRRIGRILPLGQKETSIYDADGNPSSKTDFNGRVTSYTYDSLNRLVDKKADPAFQSALLGAGEISFTYTANGLRASMIDGNGTTTYIYDALRRLTQTATPFGTLSYAYDAAGNELSVQSSHTGGASTTYSYDALNRLQTATDGSGVSTYTYDAVGNTLSLVYPNGVATSLTYNSQNRLTSIGSSKNSVPLSQYNYTLDPAGHRTAVQELSGRKVAYSYDSLYRLVSETISGATAQNGNISYMLDKTGNRTQTTSDVAAISAVSASYDSNDRLTTDSYDSAGNTIISSGSTYNYDFENHLVQAGGVTLAYDGDGNRVSKTVGGVTTSYLIDTRSPAHYAQVLEELQGGVVTHTYTYGLQLLSERQVVNGSFVTSFYGFDGTGSVRFLSDQSGNVTDTYTYDAFGNQLLVSGSTLNLYKFEGEQFDPDLNLYYNRARYLDTRTGRFRTMDTREGNAVDPRSLHKYLYANSNPVSYSDPGGTQGQEQAWGRAVHSFIGMDYVAKTLDQGCSDTQIFLLVNAPPSGTPECGRRRVPGGSGLGDRPDLAYPGIRGADDGGEIFEIKPLHSAGQAAAEVDYYISLLRIDIRQMPPGWEWHAGNFTDYIPPPIVPLPPRNYAAVLPPVGGVIPYYVSGASNINAATIAAQLAILVGNIAIETALTGRTLGQIISQGEAAEEVEEDVDEDVDEALI